MGADRKALLDGALDAIASVDQALADHARDDSGLSAALNRLDSVMSMGPDQKSRKKAVARIDFWMELRLRERKKVRFPEFLEVSDDGHWSEDPADEVEQKFRPPIRLLTEAAGVKEYKTFVCGPGQGGFLPRPGEQSEFDDLLKVES